MIKKLTIFLAVILVFFYAYIFRNEILSYLSIWFPNLQKLENIAGNNIEEIKKKIMAPPPLVGKKNAPSAYLTHDGVVKLTNAERQKQGLAALTGNARLDQAAKAKLDDMFKNQYFAHQSPAGKGPSDLADAAKYEYIIIGENLAQGNFEDDADLVKAWMDSPGHRENILNKDYKEIGVAVGKGMFEGKSTWMAVQEFGTPLNVCPIPDKTLKYQIDNMQSDLSYIEGSLKTKREAIDSTPTSKRFKIKDLIVEYNSLVKEYNQKIEDNKALIERYNAQINAYNQCLSKY